MASLPSSTMASQNKAALDYFIQLPVSRDMVCHLAKVTSQVIRCDPAPPVLSKPSAKASLTPPSTPPPEEAAGLPSLEAYITSIIQRSHVQTPTLMSSLVYLNRLQRKLPPVAKGMACTMHRIFLASLILAAKNLNDSSPKNKHWARYTSVPGYPAFGFSVTEVNLMEKQMLFLLDWDLRIRPEDLYHHLEPFLAPIRHSLELQEKFRQSQELSAMAESGRLSQRKKAAPYSSYAMDPRRTHSRTPSLSPPSRTSSISSPETDSLDDRLDSPVQDRNLYRTAEQLETGEMVVHIEQPQVGGAGKMPLMHRLQSYPEEGKPAKKARIAGTPAGFLSRLLNPSGCRVAV